MRGGASDDGGVESEWQLVDGAPSATLPTRKSGDSNNVLYYYYHDS